MYLSLHCHHQNDFCIKMGSDESHFNVSVGSDGQSHKTVSTDHNLFEENGEPKRYRTEVLPLTSLTPYHQAKPAHNFGVRSLLQSYQYPNLSEGADRVAGQLRRDKECPFNGVTKSGRVWRKVPEIGARSVVRHVLQNRSALGKSVYSHLVNRYDTYLLWKRSAVGKSWESKS